MKRKVLALFLILTLVFSNFSFALSTSSARSAEVDGHVFIGGKYLEIGVNKYGFFGTNISGGISNTPPGFHPISSYGGDIGMQVDGDGWDMGNPPTTGDMFLPGSRYEGFTIGYKDLGGAIKKNMVMNGNFSTMKSSTSTVDTSSGTKLSATTTGETSDSKVRMVQVVEFDENSKLFKIGVELENISSETIYDARYTRFVDPEPDYDKYGTFSGISSVTKNPPGSGTEALGFSKGPITGEPFIYYANDSRARVTSENYSLTDPYSPNTYNEDGSVFLKNDVSGGGLLSMTFAFGDIGAGEKVSFAMYQSLDPNIDTGLDDLEDVGGSAPSTITGSASNITIDSALLSLTIGDDGGESILESGFVYSSVDTDPMIGEADVTKVSSTVTGSSSSVSLSGLDSDTTYYYKAYATNSSGTGYGTVSSFTTLEAKYVPSVSTFSASSITETSATLVGSISSDGGSIVTEKGFVYSTVDNNPRLGSPNVSKISTTATGSAISINLSGLDSDTKYYFSAYANNSEGTGYGAVSNFTTLEAKYVPSVNTFSASSITETSATLVGSISSDGGSSVTEKGFVYSTVDNNPRLGSPNVSKISTTATGSAISINLSGLDSDTTHYYSAFATNSEGTGYGSTVDFMTLASDDSKLSSLTTSVGTLTPNFDSSKDSYFVYVANDVNSIKITPVASDSDASIKVNNELVASGDASSSITINSSLTNILVEVTAEDGATTKLYKIAVVREGSNSSSGGGSSTPNQNESKPPSKVIVIVNGEKENFGDREDKLVGGMRTAKLIVDNKSVEKRINKILNSTSDPNKANIFIIPIEGNNLGKVVSELSGNLVKKLDENDFKIELKKDDVTYNIPSKEIDIDKISEDLAEGEDLDDVKIEIEIDTPEAKDFVEFKNKLDEDKVELVLNPVSFKVKATYKSKSGQKTVDIDSFDQYVERLIKVPTNVDSSKITTAVIVNSDGSYSHIPTKVKLIDGVYYAVVKSLTNSSYSVIWNEVEFSDMDKHWAKEDVNNLGSRMIITNVDDNKFNPDNYITRSEFTSMIVRGLGLLRPNQDYSSFNDVSSNDSYHDAINIAHKYGIISGYPNNIFKPEDKITREESFVVVAKAMKVAGYAEMNGYNKSKLKFKDYEDISSWALESTYLLTQNLIISGYDGNIMPKDNITKAEAAVIVKRILSEMDLID